jgi:hypothetical protein
VFDGPEGAAVPDSRAQALVERGEVAALGAGGCQGGLVEGDAQPFGALAGPAGAALSGRLVVAWALPGPRARWREAGKTVMSVWRCSGVALSVVNPSAKPVERDGYHYAYAA